MSRDLRFWRNVILIGLAHVALLVGMIRWGGAMKKPLKTNVVWMAAPASVVAAPEPTPVSANEETPPAEAEEASPPPDVRPAPALTPAESDIPLSTPTPSPTSTPTPRPTPEPTPKPKPTDTPTPKPKASESSQRKKKPTPTPTKKKKKDQAPKASATPKKKADADKKEKASVAVDAPAQEGNLGPSDNSRSAAARAAQANAYGNMLHDRFFGAWAQPKTAAATGSKMAALVQIRIEKDGRVSEFKIARSSGNVVVDESIIAVGQRVLKVEPLPAGLDGGGHYDVRIKFELDIE